LGAVALLLAAVGAFPNLNNLLPPWG
jgi:hypothetical protein